MRKVLVVLCLTLGLFAPLGAVDLSGRWGFGIGQTTGGDLLSPSLFTLRWGLGKVVLAPEIQLSSASSEDALTNEKQSFSAFGAAAILYWPIADYPRTNLYFVGGPAFTSVSNEIEFDPNNKDRFEASSLEIRLGFGMEYWFSDHVSVNVNAGSSGFATSSFTIKETRGGTETVTDDVSSTVFDLDDVTSQIYLIWWH